MAYDSANVRKVVLVTGNLAIDLKELCRCFTNSYVFMIIQDRVAGLERRRLSNLPLWATVCLFML